MDDNPKSPNIFDHSHSMDSIHENLDIDIPETINSKPFPSNSAINLDTVYPLSKIGNLKIENIIEKYFCLRRPITLVNFLLFIFLKRVKSRREIRYTEKK